MCEKAESIGLRDVLFRRPPPTLELLGFNFGMHAISRAAETGAPVFAEPWSWPKTFYASLDRSASGGGGGEGWDEEDWEWLLRHHGHNDKIDIGGCALYLLAVTVFVAWLWLWFVCVDVRLTCVPAEWMLKASDDSADPGCASACSSNGSKGDKQNPRNGTNGRNGRQGSADSMETGG